MRGRSRSNTRNNPLKTKLKSSRNSVFDTSDQNKSISRRINIFENDDSDSDKEPVKKVNNLTSNRILQNYSMKESVKRPMTPQKTKNPLFLGDNSNSKLAGDTSGEINQQRHKHMRALGNSKKNDKINDKNYYKNHLTPSSNSKYSLSHIINKIKLRLKKI